MLYTQFPWSKIHKIRAQDQGNLRYFDTLLQKIKKIKILTWSNNYCEGWYVLTYVVAFFYVAYVFWMKKL